MMKKTLENRYSRVLIKITGANSHRIDEILKMNNTTGPENFLHVQDYLSFLALVHVLRHLERIRGHKINMLAHGQFF